LSLMSPAFPAETGTPGGCPRLPAIPPAHQDGRPPRWASGPTDRWWEPRSEEIPRQEHAAWGTARFPATSDVVRPAAHITRERKPHQSPRLAKDLIGRIDCIALADSRGPPDWFTCEDP